MYPLPRVCFKNIILTSIFLLCSLQDFAQRYNFRQYNIEDGLTQSQITAITQDGKRRLWITTLGGLSCFNGKQFCSFTKTDGLNHNFTLALTVTSNNDIWMGTAAGISRYNGEKFSNYKGPESWISKLVTTAQDEVYGLSAARLFKRDDQTTFVKVSNDPTEIVTAIRVDDQGELWAAVYHHGIFKLEGKKWKAQLVPDKLKNFVITDFLTDRFDKNKVWILGTSGLYTLKNGELTMRSTGKYTAMEQDVRGNIWVGAINGAYCLSTNGIIHFNAKNGFTDNTVNTIFKDKENNIWLGTDGAGLFRFNNSSYVIFDESQGLKNKIVMSLAKGKSPGEIWLGTYGGLFQYKNHQIKEIKMPSGNEESRKINFLYRDTDQNIWIGTVNGGLWCYDGKRMKSMADDGLSYTYHTMLEDSRKRIWLATDAGCFLLDKKSRQLKPIDIPFGSTLMETTAGSIMVGTTDGIYTINDELKSTPLHLKPLAGSSILCLAKSPDLIFCGTADNGLVIWNKKTRQTTTISTKDGLASDHIYSILIDDKGILWLGTGKGINTMDLKTLKVVRNSRENALLVECNQNAILQDKDKIWIGTTRGAIVYSNTTRPIDIRKPYIYINSVTAFTQNNRQKSKLSKTYNERDLGHIITLPYKLNNINFNFTGIFLSNPESLLYQYRLIGLDAKFSETISSTSMNFTALPAGRYTFEVRAITRSGISSPRNATFTFEITPPYYQTTLFRFFLFILFLLIILLAVYTIFTLRERKRKLRLKIKLEEQFKVRKQTAEDFHDDLGNKLTRISVLSEVLSSMIDQEDVEKRNIIHKINDNVNELYRGTKDILWSLNPKNDKLTELLNHIKEFGEEMFNDTPVHFQYHIDLDGKDGKLSMDMSRNILMIFKEAIHNALKHSKGTTVGFSAIMKNGVLEINVNDDGQGLAPACSMDGHGINNMLIRAKRINARINMLSDNNGTDITLIINFSTLMRLRNV